MGAGLSFEHAEDGDDESAELPVMGGLDEGPIAVLDEFVHAARAAPAINARTRARSFLVFRSIRTTRVLGRDPPRGYPQYPHDERRHCSSCAISTFASFPFERMVLNAHETLRIARALSCRGRVRLDRRGTRRPAHSGEHGSDVPLMFRC